MKLTAETFDANLIANLHTRNIAWLKKFRKLDNYKISVNNS
jgi:hypothetical protein